MASNLHPNWAWPAPPPPLLLVAAAVVAVVLLLVGMAWMPLPGPCLV